jgi:hypothetical protein
MLAIIAVFVGGGLVVVAAYDNNEIFGFRWWSWHQKLTLAVQTPDGPRTASAVSEAIWEMPPEWFRIGDSGGGHGTGRLKGEAAVLNLNDGKYLFVLLKGYSAELTIKIFANPPLESDNRREYAPALDRISTVRETRELSRDQYPLLVTFDDINDPASVKRVDPDNLAAAFGSGYRLTSITLSLTDEPVTEGTVEAAIQWLRALGQRQANLLGKPKAGRVSEQPDPQIYLIAPSDFSTELYK